MRKRARDFGSVRYAPFFKLQAWDPKLSAWREVKKSYATQSEAEQARPDGKRSRVMRVSAQGWEEVK